MPPRRVHARSREGASPRPSRIRARDMCSGNRILQSLFGPRLRISKRQLHPFVGDRKGLANFLLSFYLDEAFGPGGRVLTFLLSCG